MSDKDREIDVAEGEGAAQPRFVFPTGRGYQLSVIDFGNAGFLFRITRDELPEWDREASVMVQSGQVDDFLRWAGTTAGRPSMSLPGKTLLVLKRILDTGKVSFWSRQVLKKAVKVLDLVEKEKSHNVRSLSQRALNR